MQDGLGNPSVVAVTDARPPVRRSDGAKRDSCGILADDLDLGHARRETPKRIAAVENSNTVRAGMRFRWRTLNAFYQFLSRVLFPIDLSAIVGGIWMFIHEGLILRNVEEQDLEPMRVLRNDPSTWMMLTHVGFVDAQAQREWFQRVRLATDTGYYVVCDKHNPFIGSVRTDQIDPVNRSMRIGLDVVPELRGKGYGGRGYGLLKKYCFDIQNMHRIWLAVLDNNQNAMILYEKQGFKVEGRFRDAIFRDGAYHDYIIMSLLEHEYRSEPRSKGTQNENS
jgi:RimJ/RimL family protein N-acetyltransferase